MSTESDVASAVSGLIAALCIIVIWVGIIWGVVKIVKAAWRD